MNVSRGTRATLAALVPVAIGTATAVTAIHAGEAEPSDVVLPAALGTATFAFGAFIGGYSENTPQDPHAGLVNAVSAMYQAAKAYCAAHAGLDFLLSMQSVVACAVVGMVTHHRGGVAPSPEEIVIINAAVLGIAFDAAAPIAGALVGTVMGPIAGSIEALLKKCGCDIRSPASPVMPALVADAGGLAFWLSLGIKSMLGGQFFLEQGVAPPVTPTTPFGNGFASWASSIAAWGSLMLATAMTAKMHGKAVFKHFPALKPLDAMISRTNAVRDAGWKPLLVFGSASVTHVVLDMAGVPPTLAAALRGLVFGGGIYALAQPYMVAGIHRDRGAGGNTLPGPIGALQYAVDEKGFAAAEVPLRTLQARLAPVLAQRMTAPCDVPIDQHIQEILADAYSAGLTTLCTALCLHAAQAGNPFQAPQAVIDGMYQHIGLQATAFAAVFLIDALITTVGLAGLYRATADPIPDGSSKFLINNPRELERTDFDARRALAAWCAMIVGAFEFTFAQALGYSVLPAAALAVAATVVAEEVVIRYVNRGDGRPEFDTPPALRNAVRGHEHEVEPGFGERWRSYLRLAWDGGVPLAPPPARPAGAVQLAAQPVVVVAPVHESKQAQLHAEASPLLASAPTDAKRPGL